MFTIVIFVDFSTCVVILQRTSLYSLLPNAKPEFKLKEKPMSAIKIKSCKSAKNILWQLRSNGKTTYRKIIEEIFQELSSDIMGLHRILGIIVDLVLDVLT